MLHVTLGGGRTRPRARSSGRRLTRLGPFEGLGGGSLSLLLLPNLFKRVEPVLLVGSLVIIGVRLRDDEIFVNPSLLVSLDESEPKQYRCYYQLQFMSRPITNLRSCLLLWYHPARVCLSPAWSLMSKEVPQNLT